MSTDHPPISHCPLTSVPSPLMPFIFLVSTLVNPDKTFLYFTKWWRTSIYKSKLNQKIEIFLKL